MISTSIQWTLVAFKLLASTGAGLLAFVGLTQLIGTRVEASRKAITVSIVLCALAGVSVLLQVGKPEGIMRVFSNISLESPLSWELLSYGGIVIVGIAYLLLAKGNKVLVKLLAVLAIIVAVVFGFTTGYSHVSMPGMPSWHTPAMPVCFLLSALLLGGVCYLIICSKDEDRRGYDFVVRIVILLAALVTVSSIAYGITAELGAYALVYWIAVPLVGGVISLGSALLLKYKNSIIWLYSALIASLVGAVSMRAIVWVIVETGLSSGNIIHI